MRKFQFLIVICLLPKLGWCDQEVSIGAIKGNHNTIKGVQSNELGSENQKLKTGTVEGDSNRIESSQTSGSELPSTSENENPPATDTIASDYKTNVFSGILDNTKNLFITLSAITAFIISVFTIRNLNKGEKK